LYTKESNQNGLMNSNIRPETKNFSRKTQGKSFLKPGMVAHAYNPSYLKQRLRGSWIKASPAKSE
jgi:hypothetical protein